MRSLNRLLDGVPGLSVDIAPPGKLTAVLGDTVRVSLGVDYIGPAISGQIHVTFGHKNAWFNEDGAKQTDINVNFPLSTTWVTRTFTANIYIGGAVGIGFDLYAKIIGVPGPDIFTPTYLNVLDVIGAAEFRNFAINNYDIL